MALSTIGAPCHASVPHARHHRSMVRSDPVSEGYAADGWSWLAPGSPGWPRPGRSPTRVSTSPCSRRGNASVAGSGPPRLTNGAVVELGAEWIMDDDTVVRETAARFDVPLADTGASYGRREPWGPGAASLEAQDGFLEAANVARAATPRRGGSGDERRRVPRGGRGRRCGPFDRDASAGRHLRTDLRRGGAGLVRRRPTVHGARRAVLRAPGPGTRRSRSSSPPRSPMFASVMRSTRSSVMTRGVTVRWGRTPSAPTRW